MLQGGIEEARRIMNNLRPSFWMTWVFRPTIELVLPRISKGLLPHHDSATVTVRDEEVPGPLKIVMFRVCRKP